MTITAFNEAIRKMSSLEYDLTADIAHYLQTRRVNSGANAIEDVINFTVKLWDLESPEGQCCFPVLQLGDRSTSGEYWLAKNTQGHLYQEDPAVLFEKYRLDVLVLPTEFSSSRLGAVGRLPVGSVPLGYDDINLPFGMALMGPRYDEESVIRSMSAYEANSPRGKVPHLL
ncbi:unnamed protein product [Penicillium viridicatum]